MDELSKLSRGMSLRHPFRHDPVHTGLINEVYKTLFEAGTLVPLVIFLFLQNWRATLVPAITVPVTIIGTFRHGGLGFTINIVTLFGLILAIGIVVDDAIVIVENAAHDRERPDAREAAITAMDDLTGPVIGITLVLMAVFVPPHSCPASPASSTASSPSDRRDAVSAPSTP